LRRVFVFMGMKRQQNIWELFGIIAISFLLMLSLSGGYAENREGGHPGIPPSGHPFPHKPGLLTPFFAGNREQEEHDFTRPSAPQPEIRCASAQTSAGMLIGGLPRGPQKPPPFDDTLPMWSRLPFGGWTFISAPPTPDARTIPSVSAEIFDADRVFIPSRLHVATVADITSLPRDYLHTLHILQI
jgi:hypothetical protein